MKRTLSLLALALVILPAVRAQQISIELRIGTDSYLLYESMAVEVSIRNNTGRALEFGGGADKNWLRFLITNRDGRAVESVGEMGQETVLIGARQTVSRVVDLLPLYDLREAGEFRVQALVETDGMRGSSPVRKFVIQEGRPMWSQSVGLRGATATNDQFRTYSIIVKRGEKRDTLYAGVTDEQRGKVYGMEPLGPYIPLGEPEVQVDQAGTLHVLWRAAPRAFGYVNLDQDAHALKQEAYTDITTMPRLMRLADGTVTVTGGEQLKPRSERVLTQEELQPPPAAPPPPPPKRRWWWPSPKQEKPPAAAPTQ